MYTAWPDVVLAVTLALQLILSVLYQFRRLAGGNLGRVARILALPSWCFFAPRPGTTDYRLLSRCESVADVGYWNELDIGWRGRYVRRALWNPEKIAHKALADCLQIIVATAAALPQKHERLLYVSRAYLTVLSYVLASIKAVPGSTIEFAIVESHGFGETRSAKPVFVSLRHRV